MALALLEEAVLVRNVLSVFGLVGSKRLKVVHVQLAKERREFVVLEVFRKDFLTASLPVLDDEFVKVGLNPGNQIVCFRVIYHFEEVLDESGYLLSFCHRLRIV